MTAWVRWTPEAVAEVLGAAPDGMTPVEFAHATGLSVTRAYRVLSRGLDRGDLTRDNGGSGTGRPARYRCR